MATTGIFRFSLVGLCIVAFLATCLGVSVGMSYHNPGKDADPQSALDMADLYKAMQDPYSYTGPQSELDRAVALKAIQKLYGSDGPFTQDNWGYWMNIWLNAE
ncbi:MAG: hypothetical protein LUQ59_03675 [Methanothrix sp.]|nr:hypothetical protein [Methanothrix sp.]